MENECACHSGKKYEDCCGAYHRGKAFPKTAEGLMRSRYSAFAHGEIAYLRDTYHPSTKKEFDEKSAAEWSKNSQWHGFDVKMTDQGLEKDDKGIVEFVARYSVKGEEYAHHEIAEFKKEQGKWYFVDGNPPNQDPIVREEPKVGRNDPCSCGSGKKYKKCCGG